MKPKASISRSPKGTYVLSLTGHFSHPHWIVFLFSGLSAQKISVVSGTARRTPTNDWNARVEVDCRNSTASPERLDYLAMTEQQREMDRTAPVLVRYEVERRTDQSLSVRLEGPDQVGFLGRLLYKISVLGLFPTEMEIDTVGGKIQDRIVFHGIGGLSPSESVQKLLSSMLTSWVQRA